MQIKASSENAHKMAVAARKQQNLSYRRIRVTTIRIFIIFNRHGIYSEAYYENDDYYSKNNPISINLYKNRQILPVGNN